MACHTGLCIAARTAGSRDGGILLLPSQNQAVSQVRWTCDHWPSYVLVLYGALQFANPKPNEPWHVDGY